ncbi:MAG: hypothetical protein WCG06_01035, partial [Candidatus Omnitrophota bacterium]
MSLIYAPPLIMIGLLLVTKVIVDIWFVMSCFKAGFWWGLGLLLFPLAIEEAGRILPYATASQTVQPALVMGFALFLVLLLARHWDNLKRPLITIVFLIVTLVATVFGSIFVYKNSDESISGFIKRAASELSPVSTRLAASIPGHKDFSIGQYLSGIIRLAGRGQESTAVAHDLFAIFSLGIPVSQPRTSPAVATYTAVPKELAVFTAIRDGSAEHVSFLMNSSDIDWNKPSVEGQTPLTFAVLSGHP